MFLTLPGLDLEGKASWRRQGLNRWRGTGMSWLMGGSGEGRAGLLIQVCGLGAWSEAAREESKACGPLSPCSLSSPLLFLPMCSVLWPWPSSSEATGQEDVARGSSKEELRWRQGVSGFPLHQTTAHQQHPHSMPPLHPDRPQCSWSLWVLSSWEATT